MLPPRVVTFLKQFKVLFSPSALIAAMVVIFTVGAIVLPTLASKLFAEEVQFQLSKVREMNRALNGSMNTADNCIPWAAWETRDCWAYFDEEIAKVTAGIEDPLGSSLSKGDIHFQFVSLTPTWSGEDLTLPDVAVAFSVYRDLADQINLLEGRFPNAIGEELQQWLINKAPPYKDKIITTVPTKYAIEFVTSVAAAEQMQDWQVGEVRYIEALRTTVDQAVRDTGMKFPIKLVGVYEAKDPNAGYWQRFPLSRDGALFDDGNRRPVFTGAAYLNPADLGIWQVFQVAPFVDKGQVSLLSEPVSVNIWYPVDTTQINPENANEFAAQLRREAATTHNLDFLPRALSISTGINEAVGSINSRDVLMTTTYALIVIGPIGVALVVLMLTSQIALQRLAAANQIQRARGATATFLRSRLFMLAILVSLPAAIVGAAIGLLITGGAINTNVVVIVVAAAVVPAVIMAFSLHVKGMHSARNDLGEGKASLGRRILEMLLFALAVIGVGLLLLRGEAKNVALEIDPLVLATPLLVALAGSILVLRFYPVPLAFLEGRYRKQKGATNWLGVIRNRRDAAVGTIPVFALVLGATVAVFASIFSAAIVDGIKRSVTAEVGSDLRISGPWFSDDVAEAIGNIPGIAGQARLADAGTLTVRAGSGAPIATKVFIVDADLFAQVQRDVYGGVSEDIAAQLKNTTTEYPAALFGTTFEGMTDLAIDGKQVSQIGVYPTLPGADQLTNWVLFDRSGYERLFGSSFVARVMLIDLAEGVSAEDVFPLIQEEVRSFASSTMQEAEGRILASPIVNAFGTILWGVIVLTVILLALTVMLMLVIQRPERARTFAMLTTLGAAAKQRRRLLLWEIVPVTVVSAIAATLFGYLLARLLVFLVNFNSFTGGIKPIVAYDLTSLLIPVGIVVVSAFVVWLFSPLLARVNVLAQLRLGA
ncbi:MAG: ABC transporter permease [Microbacteriaceae bacterium]|nr:ABC transporter permease [Microbacteriaceae bacterium]